MALASMAGGTQSGSGFVKLSLRCGLAVRCSGWLSVAAKKFVVWATYQLLLLSLITVSDLVGSPNQVKETLREAAANAVGVAKVNRAKALTTG